MTSILQFRTVGSAVQKQCPDEARRLPRRRVLKAGIIASNDRHLTVACTVRDLSETGARVKVEGTLTIPDTFELIIEVEGLEANCEVAWRARNEVGVRFLGSPRKVTAKRVQIVNPLIPSAVPSLRRKPIAGK